MTIDRTHATPATHATLGWLWRLAIWTALLTPCSLLVARDYRLLIGQLIAWGSTCWGYPLELAEVGVGMPNDGLIFRQGLAWIQTAFYSPMDLGFFAAMCLATFRAHLRARMKAILTGFALLVSIQLLLVTCCLLFMILDAADGALRFQTQLTWTRIMGTAPWVVPMGAWVLLLGRSGLKVDWLRKRSRSQSRAAHRKARIVDPSQSPG